MSFWARFLSKDNAKETARQIEERDREAREERQLARLNKSEFINNLFQGMVDQVAERGK